MSDGRDLTEREREVLRVLVADLSAETKAEAEAVRVIGGCQCGCATVYFSDAPGNHQLVDAVVDGSHDIVILFGWEGGPLTALEIASVSDEPPREFPPPHTLMPTRRA